MKYVLNCQDDYEQNNQSFYRHNCGVISREISAQTIHSVVNHPRLATVDGT